jgi:hypothetical protein
LPDPLIGTTVGGDDPALPIDHEEVGLPAEQFSDKAPGLGGGCEIQADDAVVIDLLDPVDARAQYARP